MLTNSKIKLHRKLWLLVVASIYLFGNFQFLILEGLHEVSHILSKVEFHHHEIDHMSGKEHSHHHETIDFLSKLFSPSKTPYKDNEVISIPSIDKHFSPKTLSFIVLEQKEHIEFPYYNKLLLIPFFKVPIPPPKEFVAFSI